MQWNCNFTSWASKFRALGYEEVEEEEKENNK